MENKRYFGQNIDVCDDSELEKCIKHFSATQNGNAVLNFNDFKRLISNFLTDPQGKSYEVSDTVLNELFTKFDVNCDKKIEEREFKRVWDEFITPLLRPVTALLVIDVQNDFIEGSLAMNKCPAKQDGKDVIPVINNLIETHKFDFIVYSIDFHPEDHISFFENIRNRKLSNKNKNKDELVVFDTVIFDGPTEMCQKLWPTHCVQNTWGCKLHDNLKISDDPLFVYKGQNSSTDSYSAFFDNMKASSTVLHEELKKRNVTHVFVCGVAFDYCVAFTALDASELGYATTIIEDATAGTDENYIKIMKDKLISQNCVLTSSQEIESLISGKNRKVEFACTILDFLKRA